MPREKSLLRHRTLPVARGVEHHVGPCLGFAGACPGLRGKYDHHPLRHAGAHVVAVQPLALDLGGVEDFRRQRLEYGLLTDVEADGVQPSGELAKFKRRLGEDALDLAGVPPEAWPIL